MTDKQADFINESFEILKRDASLNKSLIDSIKTQYNINNSKYKALSDNHSTTVRALETLTNKYGELSKKSNDSKTLAKLDRNAELSMFSIVASILILIVIQHH